MREFCLTEDVIQRFVDGELSPEQTENAAAHLAACDDCAQLLDEVEQGNALLMEAFTPEMSLAVPTAALRERLDAAIAELAPRPNRVKESAGSNLRGWFGSLFGSFSFTPQQAFGFASLAVVVAFAAVFVVIQLRQNKDATQTVAVNPGQQPKAQPSLEPSKNGGNETPLARATAPEVTVDNNRQTPSRAGARRADKPAGSSRPVIKAPATPATETPEPKFLPGEEGYLEAIASLTTAIEANKDDVLRPTVRADYERNLAVVDQAIATTRQQVKRNPKDREAAEFMYTAYQNKVELLSAVADQTRIASR
jgi:hypothetical protein